ncbi:ethanolamine ammonia-lyase heavy chain [Citrobacter amalonaticus]|nr:ethanolamine ammonia-lyase heavy chain [Citrobacter amalonaticus]
MTPRVDDIAFTRKGLTSEVVAAVAKICSNADLIYGGKKMPVIKKANTTIGIPGTFSCRLQPNDTRDDVQSIAAQIYEGLSFGAGDAVIGVNPVTGRCGELKPRTGHGLWGDRQVQHPDPGLCAGARYHAD